MIYTIKKRNHGCFHLPKFHFGLSSLMFNFKLSNSCNYDLKNVNNFDINKLFGVSWGHHHTNSFRIGWCKDDKENYFNIYTYSYNNKIRKYNALLTVKSEERALCIILPDYINNNISGYIVTESNIANINEGFIFPKCKLGYYLYPYFGGDEKSPHTMKIEINKL